MRAGACKVTANTQWSNLAVRVNKNKWSHCWTRTNVHNRVFFFLIQLSFLILWLSPQELYQQTNLWKAVLPWVNLQICLGLNIVETCWDGVSNTGLVILKTFKCPHLPICVIFILVSDLTSTPFLYQVPLTFSSDTSHLKTAWSFAFTVRSAMLW